MLARLIKSDSLRSALAFAGGGVGFAAGNILLAKILSPASFGVVTLALALNQFGLTFGPFGLEVVANRHRPRVDRRLALLAVSAATVTALGVAVIAGAYYGNNSGTVVRITLPNTKLGVFIPLMSGYMSVGGTHEHDPKRGVIPDFPVQRTVADLVAGVDRDFNLALELSRKSR